MSRFGGRYLCFREGRVTLLYAATGTQRNIVVVLKGFFEEIE